MAVRVEHGDCLEVMAALIRDGVTVQSVVCDPPYHLTSIVKRFATTNADRESFAVSNPTTAYRSLSRGFMGKTWDGGDVAFRPETWRLVYDLLPPGGHVLAFGGTRSYHRLACAIEDAGFEIRDQIGWAYGSGFPKSHDVAKGIDKAAGLLEHRGKAFVTAGGEGRTNGGDKFRSDHPDYVPYAPATEAARQWQGWGTALKPAWEPLCVARKPLDGTVAANVLRWGTGALNIDGCRVAADWETDPTRRGWQGRNLSHQGGSVSFVDHDKHMSQPNADGRWPANLIHDGSDEVLAAFPETGTSSSRPRNNNSGPTDQWRMARQPHVTHGHADSGSAARFFYSAKATAADRIGSKHPTVKPVDLMRWLVRLVTPPGGTVLDPFAGSGTTGMACLAEGFDAILIEREAEYVADIHRRLAHVSGADTPLFETAQSALL